MIMTIFGMKPLFGDVGKKNPLWIQGGHRAARRGSLKKPGSPMAQQACKAVQGCVSYGAGYISAGGPGEPGILSSQIRQRMPLDFAQIAKQQARTVLPFPLNDGILGEAWMQLPPPYRSTFEACIDAYKVRRLCPRLCSFFLLESS
jgi:hypothetical protein